MKPQIYWGNVIRNARIKKNITQKEVAALLGISRQCYSCYETGRLRPSPELITALSELYDFDFWGYAFRSMPYEFVSEVHTFKAEQAKRILDDKASKRRALPTKDEDDQI